MNSIRFGLLYFVFLFSCNHSTVNTVNRYPVKQKKGYLLITGQDEVLFFPDNSAKANWSLDDIPKSNGFQIRGNTTYDLYKIRRIAPKIQVKMKFFSEDGSSKLIAYDIRAIPVKIKYSLYNSQLPNREGAVAFEFNGRHYSYDYSDDFDGSIDEFIPINKNDLEKFRVYKE